MSHLYSALNYCSQVKNLFLGKQSGLFAEIRVFLILHVVIPTSKFAKITSTTATTTATITTSTCIMFSDLIACQEVRLRHLTKVCEKQNMSVRNLSKVPSKELEKKLRHFVVDDRHKLILRAIPKTGCSSWKTALVNNSVIKRKINTIHAHSWNWITSISDLRLLSRERNRDVITSKLRNYFNILTVRHPLDRLESGFREKFLKRHTEIDQHDTKAVVTAFQDFLNRRIKETNMDKHWKPISITTDPCSVPFR